MTRGQLKTQFRLRTPNATKTNIDDTKLETEIGFAVDEVNLVAKVYKGDAKFNVTAEKQEYKVSEQSNLQSVFLAFASPGLFWNDGSKWNELFPKTQEWMDKNFPGWRNQSSGTPKFYWKEGDSIFVHPKPDTTLANGFWAYFVKKSETVTSDDNYLWNNSTTEILSLRPMDKAILAYLQWTLGPTLGIEQASMVMSEAKYRRILAIAARQVKSRTDLSRDRDFRLRIQGVY